jgi:ankyrin repeat protein
MCATDKLYNYILKWSIRRTKVEQVKTILDNSFILSQNEKIIHSIFYQKKGKNEEKKVQILRMLLDKGYKTFAPDFYNLCIKHNLNLLLKLVEENFSVSDEAKTKGFETACSLLNPKVAKNLFPYSNIPANHQILNKIIKNHCVNGKNNKKLYKILHLLFSSEPKIRAHENSLHIILNRCFKDEDIEHLEPVLEILLDNGANINHNAGSPMMRACSKNFGPLVKFLIKKGSRVDIKEDHPIYFACRSEDLQLLKYLVKKRGLSLKGHKSRNQTPLQIVKNNEEMTKYIKSVLKKDNESK